MRVFYLYNNYIIYLTKTLKTVIFFFIVTEERLDIIDALINDMELLQEMQVSKRKHIFSSF